MPGRVIEPNLDRVRSDRQGGKFALGLRNDRAWAVGLGLHEIGDDGGDALGAPGEARLDGRSGRQRFRLLDHLYTFIRHSLYTYHMYIPFCTFIIYIFTYTYIFK